MPKKILVVDDSRIAQLQLQKILADSDYEVVGCCQSGEEALELYDKLSPDLVTMDILMPGMDGLEAARLLLQKDPKAHVLMVSSLAYDDTIDEANEIGASGFVYKPFDREAVLDSIRQVFAGE
ncbi:MAG: response regulator [Clostridiales bacterium]|nr:response regulator [Clostridiales bacterium]